MNDLISRQATIDFICSMEMCDEISAEAYKKLTNYLDELPSAEPKWILCSDRMPPDPAGCFVTAMDGVFTIGFIARWTGEQWCDDANNPCIYDVIAWMPLPEPYKEGRTGA